MQVPDTADHRNKVPQMETDASKQQKLCDCWRVGSVVGGRGELSEEPTDGRGNCKVKGGARIWNSSLGQRKETEGIFNREGIQFVA